MSELLDNAFFVEKYSKCYMYILKVPKNPDLGSDAERVRKEEQGRIDESEELDDAENAEKEELLKQVCVLFEPGHAKRCLMPYADNKGAAQPVHPSSLISTFIVRCLDSMIYILAISKVSRF